MPSRIQVLLDYPFSALYGEGYGFSKLAGALRFAERQTVDGVSTLKPASSCPGFWKVPALGVITREPRFLSYGTLQYDDPNTDVYKAADAEISTNDDATPGGRLMLKAGTVARTRSSASTGLTGLVVSADFTALVLKFANATMKQFWRTLAPLKINEGWAIQITPARVPDDPRSQGYVMITFGNKFGLGINLQGTAVLYENYGTQAVPKWFERKKMDVGGGGVDLSKSFFVTCIPVGQRYIVLRFGNVRFKGAGFRLQRYVDDHDFVYDVREDGRAGVYDAAKDQFVAIPEGKLGIAINGSGVHYLFLPYKLRYDTNSKTALFTGEPLPNPLPGETPTLTPYGYAANTGDADPELRTGSGTMTATYKGATGAAWDSNTDELLCPEVTMEPTDSKYTPELWYLEAHAYPFVFTPDYTPVDVSNEWVYIRFQRTLGMEATQCTIKLNDEQRASGIMKRGGPIRITIDGDPVFDGYVNSRKPTAQHRFVKTEIEARDMWVRLQVPCGEFESLDGKKLSLIIERLLRRAGFGPAEVEIVDDLGGLSVGGFDEPQTLKIYNHGTTVEEAIKDLVERYSIQGIERIRVRWNGLKWLAYLTPYGAQGDDPVFVMCAAQEAEPAGTDQARWEAGWLRITSALEWDITHPQYNKLRTAIATGGGEGGSSIKAKVDPHPDVLYSPLSQMFEGLVRPIEKTLAVTTKEELAIQTRVMYDDESRKVVGMGVQAEWQPGVDVDQEFAVIGHHPTTGVVISFGVFRIEAIDVEISQDETAGSSTFTRSYDWSGAYRLRYLRPTSDIYQPLPLGPIVPMFDGLLPPPGYLTMPATPPEEP